VPEEVSMDIIVLRDSYSLARRVCKVWPMGRDTITVPKLTSGLTAYAVGEAHVRLAKRHHRQLGRLGPRRPGRQASGAC
jgi:HK97 family phage major capsid protein